jgi:hypothetical protein
MKDDQSAEFYMWEITLCWILSLILSLYRRDLGIGEINVMSVRSFEQQHLERVADA